VENNGEAAAIGIELLRLLHGSPGSPAILTLLLYKHHLLFKGQGAYPNLAHGSIWDGGKIRVLEALALISRHPAAR